MTDRDKRLCAELRADIARRIKRRAAQTHPAMRERQAREIRSNIARIRARESGNYRQQYLDLNPRKSHENL